METTLSLNWIVLLMHLTSRSATHEQNWNDLLVNCNSGLNLAADLEVGKRCDFLNRPEKASKQATQKEASKLMLKFNNAMDKPY